MQSLDELIESAKSLDSQAASRASRQLLERHHEPNDRVPDLIEVLRHPDRAVANYAFLALSKLGEPAVDQVADAFKTSGGEFRRLLMGLIAGVASFDIYYPLLRKEIEFDEQENRYWAANCFGRNFSINSDWPSDATKLLAVVTELLQSSRSDPRLWMQARMTLRHLRKQLNAAENNCGEPD